MAVRRFCINENLFSKTNVYFAELDYTNTVFEKKQRIEAALDDECVRLWRRLRLKE